MLQQKVAEAKQQLTKLQEKQSHFVSQSRSASLRIMSRSNAVIWEKAKQRYRHKLDEHGMRPVLVVGATFAALVLPFAFFAAFFNGLGIALIASCVSVTVCIVSYRTIFCGSDERTSQCIRDHERAKTEATQQKNEMGSAISAIENEISLVLSELSELEPELAKQIAADEARQRANEFDNLSKNLLKERWRELRGIDFEKYVQRVFEHLGYETEGTPVTGDQGVDLIVITRSQRMAVQIKGYFHSVGNSAVQQVVAGMRHHDCSRACVVTNSRFTSSAMDLAKSNDCHCIGEVTFEDFVYGRIFPRAHRDIGTRHP